MDSIPQNGESSSPKPLPMNGTLDDSKPARGSARLILPTWDIPPLKPLHASHDLLSLLHLTPLYNTYVAPYATIQHDDLDPHSHEDHLDSKAIAAKEQAASDDEMLGLPPKKSGSNTKKKSKKTLRLDKNYIHLLDDVIDPIPLGGADASGGRNNLNRDHRSLINLMGDYLVHNSNSNSNVVPASGVWDGPIEVLGDDVLGRARLEVGLKQDGYAGGEKIGVREAEERRRKRKQRQSISTLPEPQSLHHLPPSEPGTPLLPVLPPSRPFGLHNRTGSGSALGFGTRPQGGQQQQPGGIRPTSNYGIPGFGMSSNSTSSALSVQAGQAGQGIQGGPTGLGGYGSNKRPGGPGGLGGSGGGLKRAKGPGGSRTASPMPSGGGSGVRLLVKPGQRARTEDV